MPAVSPPAIGVERFMADGALDQIGGEIHEAPPRARKRDQPAAIDIDRAAAAGGEGEGLLRAEQDGFRLQQDAGGDLGGISRRGRRHRALVSRFCARSLRRNAPWGNSALAIGFRSQGKNSAAKTARNSARSGTSPANASAQRSAAAVNASIIVSCDLRHNGLPISLLCSSSSEPSTGCMRPSCAAPPRACVLFRPASRPEGPSGAAWS